MSKFEKQLNKLMSVPNDMRYEELKSILIKFGFHGYESGSSHITFRKKGYPNITIPRHGDIKKVYIMLVKDVISEVLKNEK